MRQGRVLILATRVPVRAGDGTPSFVLDNALPLSDRFKISIISPRVKGAREHTTLKGIKITRFAYFPRRWESLAEDAIVPQLRQRPWLWLQALSLTLLMLIAALRRIHLERPDVIHAQWILPAGLVALALRALTGTPYLVTAQGADAFRFESSGLRRVKKMIVGHAGYFVGVSAEITERYRSVGASTEFATQPSGIDFAFWGDVGQRTHDGLTVLFVGRLAAKKGVDTAVRAIRGLDKVKLRVIGAGPELRQLLALVDETGVADRVTFLGQKDREQLLKEFRSATCIVIPSVTAPDGDRDGTPNVLGEAVAAGVPIVASRIAGLQELLEHGSSGLLHEPGDPNELGACIRRLLDEPFLGDRLAKEAKRQLRATLDLARVADRYAGWYAELGRLS